MADRKDITEDVIQFQSAKEVAEELDISPETLKKYSLLFEKLSDNAVMYDRNDRNSRIYTVTDVMQIRRTLTKKDVTHKKLEDAVTEVLIEDEILPVTVVTDNITTSVTENKEGFVTADDLITVMKMYNGYNDELIKVNQQQQEMIQELTETNKELSQKMQDLIDAFGKDKEERKALEVKENEKKWWQFWK